jgi:hypothetical protein
MRRETQRLVTRLSPPDAVGIRTLAVRIEDAIVVPQPIEEGAHLRKLRILARQHFKTIEPLAEKIPVEAG